MELNSSEIKAKKHPPISLTRDLRFGGKRLVVVDGLFSAKEVVEAYEYLFKLRYELGDYDVAETKYAKHWKVEFPKTQWPVVPIFATVIDLTQQIFAENLSLCRVHSNLHMYGDLQFPHTDLQRGVTALYFANPVWSEKWMGETIFYDDQRDPIYAIAPKAGRVVIFHADIVHRAGVPSRDCFTPRISVAFKFVKR